jgi:hypothetical protein
MRMTVPRNRHPPPWTVSAPGSTRTDRILSAIRYELVKRRSHIDADDDMASVSIIVKLKTNTIEPRRVLVQFQTESGSS